MPIVGTGLTSSPERAAFVNGTLGHALDFDDTVSSMPGHPGAVVIHALLAALGDSPVTGRDFLTAVAVGYEVATKLGASIGMGHYNRGWHSTGSIGVFGATAAVSNLLRLDQQQVGHAIGITTSLASGLRANFGTMTKPIHSGWAASSGLTAAQLAACGLTSSDQALDAFYQTYGTAESDQHRLALGAPFTIQSPGIAFKKYACCFAMHRAIDALEQFRAEGVLGDEADVVKVTARVAPGVLKPLPYRRPVTGLEGKFSMEYALAIGVVDGDFSLHGFTDQAVLRPEIRAALERTEVREDPHCSPGDPEGRSASAGTRGFVEVVVDTGGGAAQHVKTVAVPPGSPLRPMSDHEIRSKFADCAEFAGFSDTRAKAIVDLIDGLDEVADVAEILSLIAGSTRVGAQV